MYGIYKIMKKITLIIMEGAQFDQSTITLTTEQRRNTLGLLAQDPILEPTWVHAVQEQLETGGTTISTRKTKM